MVFEFIGSQLPPNDHTVSPILLNGTNGNHPRQIEESVTTKASEHSADQSNNNKLLEKKISNSFFG